MICCFLCHFDFFNVCIWIFKL